MSHNLEFSVKKQNHSMFSVKEKPWHGLGKIVEEALTSVEAIEVANLDFEVIKIQNTVNHQGIDYISPGSFSTFRTDTKKVLGAVGKDYTIVQNKDAFVFFDNIVGEERAIFETAGVLGVGEQVFITAKLPKSVVVDDIDLIDQYLLLTNAHDGSRSVEVLFTPIRVVCDNTLTAALQLSKNRIKIRHTKSVKDNLEKAHKLLGIHTELVTEQHDIYNMIADKQIGVEEFQTYVCNVFLTKSELEAVAKVGLKNIESVKEISTRKVNIIDSVANYYEYGPGQELKTAKNTMWGAYNAITGYFQNVKDFKDDDKKVRSNFYGTNYNTMHKAYATAVDMTGDNVEILTQDGVGYKSKYN